jgi:predicted peptidase
VDEFIQGEFRGLKYNLFVPRNYDKNKSYPLVQFIVDSWGVGPDYEITLAQGLGGVIWANPEDQAKHECFILSPQFPGPTIVEDDFSATEELETAKSLLDHIMSQYNIDRNRVYATGQSMGFLSSCELNIRYPKLFAGSLMVSGFWNPETMTALKDKNMWFFVSEGDDKAYDIMNKAIENLEAAGAKVSRYIWNGKAGKEALNEAIRKASGDGCNIKYTVFEKDSTVPEGLPADTASNHRGTWHLLYGLEAIRDWLFTNQIQG